jgi:hypothetical protein
MTLTKQQRRRDTANRRKVYGDHHRKTEKHYAKAYWPYLPVFAVLGLGLLANVFIHRHDHNVLGYATNVSSNVLLAETNAARTSNHQDALEINPALTSAAQAKANDMAKRNYWSHMTPDGKQPWSFIDSTNYQYEAAGENLAYGFGTSTQIVTAWMNSPEHRANILNANYRDVGFATANAPDYLGQGAETIIVALYAEPTNLNATTHATNNYDDLSVSEPVSRLQIVTAATWVQLGLAALCGTVITLFAFRHALAWRRVISKGEAFVLHHPFLDTFLISLVVFAFLMSHWAGTIL